MFIIRLYTKYRMGHEKVQNGRRTTFSWPTLYHMSTQIVQ